MALAAAFPLYRLDTMPPGLYLDETLNAQHAPPACSARRARSTSGSPLRARARLSRLRPAFATAETQVGLWLARHPADRPAYVFYAALRQLDYYRPTLW